MPNLAASTEDRQYYIIGYLQDSEDWSAKDIDVFKLTHINYAFALVRENEVTGKHLTKLNELQALKRINPKLKILISIGGLGADGFSDAALTNESRHKFADSAIEFMKDYHFDGIDVDWEYPCSTLMGIAARPEDKQNYTLMLKLLRQKLDNQGKHDDTYYMLTIAAVAVEDFFENTELDKVHDYLDYINLMTYDLVNQFDTRTGHHTNLYASKMDPDRLNGNMTVHMVLSQGVSPEKIVLGSAFYGRGWSGADNIQNGFNQPTYNSEHHFYGYSELKENYINKNNFTRYWDADAKAPYLFDGNTFITYEDEQSIKHKTDYIKSKGLGGIVFWEYNLDHSGVLLHALYKGLQG